MLIKRVSSPRTSATPDSANLTPGARYGVLIREPDDFVQFTGVPYLVEFPRAGHGVYHGPFPGEAPEYALDSEHSQQVGCRDRTYDVSPAAYAYEYGLPRIRDYLLSDCYLQALSGFSCLKYGNMREILFKGRNFQLMRVRGIQAMGAE